MRARFPGMLIHTVAVCAVVAVVLPNILLGQRLPGLGTGFYTTTGLVTADVEVGSITSSSAMAEAPTVAMSVLVTAPLQRLPKRAWIVGLRANVIGFGNNDGCYVTPGTTGCQNLRFQERGAFLLGGAFDIRSTVLRTTIGPALYSVEKEGARLGTTLRVDYAAPRLRGATPTLFFTRTFLGSQRGEAVGLSTLGAGMRWVRKK